MQKTIQNYAHDYRDMKMSQEELVTMLSNFLEEINKTPKIVEDYVEQELIKYIDGVKDAEGEWVIKPIDQILFSDYQDGDDTVLETLYKREDKLNYLKNIYTKLL